MISKEGIKRLEQTWLVLEGLFKDLTQRNVKVNVASELRNCKTLIHVLQVSVFYPSTRAPALSDDSLLTLQRSLGEIRCSLISAALNIDEDYVKDWIRKIDKAAIPLAKGKVELEPTVAYVDLSKCDGCAMCIEACAFKALGIEEREEKGTIKKRAIVNEALCKGCGACAAICPPKAIYVKHFTLDQISIMIDAALGVTQSTGGSINLRRWA